MFVFTKTRIFASKRLMTRVMTRLRIAGLPLCVGLMLAGCARRAEQPPPAPVSYQPEMKQAPPTPIAEKKQELGEQSWDPQWDKIVEEALSPEMLSGRVAREVRSSCPRFATMSDGDKRAFWAYLFQALAGAEAGLKPTTDVRHTEPVSYTHLLVSTKVTPPGVARPCHHNQSAYSVTEPLSPSNTTICVVPLRVPFVQWRYVRRLHLFSTRARRASSRDSAPNDLTTALQVTASAIAPPTRVS